MPITTTTTAATVIAELWSALTRDAREENLEVWNRFDHSWESELSGGGDTVHIQGIQNFSTAARTLGVGGSLTYDAGQFETQVNLIIDTHSYQAFDLETEAQLMSNINLMEKFSRKSGYGVALTMDDAAAAFIDDGASGSGNVGTLNTPLDEEDVRRGTRLLDDSLAPTDNRTFLMSPAQREHFMGVERLVNSLYGTSVGNLNLNQQSRGAFAHSHGADWVVSGNTEGSNTVGHDNGMWQREAVAVAAIDNMRTVTFYNIDTDSDKFATHSIYGLVLVRADHMIFMRGL